MSAPTPTTTADNYTATEYAEEFRAAMGKIAGVYATNAATLYGAWQAGKITTPEWQVLFTRSLLYGNAHGVGVGDAMAARYLYLAHGRPVQPLNPTGALDVTTEVDRLGKAVDTLTKVIDTAEDPRPRIQRLATSEPINAAQQSAVKAFAEHKVIGYRRGIRPDACELCHWLKKVTPRYPEGYVYPIDQPMHQHPGCTCVPIPVTE